MRTALFYECDLGNILNMETQQRTSGKLYFHEKNDGHGKQGNGLAKRQRCKYAMTLAVPLRA